MKNFGVEIKFRVYLKITYRSANPGAQSEIDHLVPVDVTERLQLQRQLDPKTGAFVSGQLFDRATGRVQVMVDEVVSYQILKKALAKAREVIVPEPVHLGKKPPKRKK